MAAQSDTQTAFSFRHGRETRLQLPTLSFVDQVWDGEQFWNRVNPSRNYGNEMTYDWFRSEYLGQHVITSRWPAFA